METIPASVAVEIEHQLTKYGIQPQGDVSQLNWSDPVPLALEVAGQIVDTAAMYMPEMSATAALKAAHSVPLDVPLFIVGSRIHASSADTMRTRGIWFIDEVGNAYLRGHGLLIDVRGQRGHVSVPSGPRDKSSPANPFTPKRAQVVLILLDEPALADAPLREIAERSGVSLGMAKDAIDALEHIGFVEQLGSRRRLIRQGELLDLWASAYPAGLGRANRLAVVRGDVHEWATPREVDFAVSGECAVPRLIRNPESLVLYVDGGRDKRLLRDLMLMNHWHKDPHGNIIVRDLFWRDLHPTGEPDTAPVPLVYADLLASRESRQLEVADEMRRSNEGLVEL
ncbi:type IV toxin-antitoxin system AbiEi family antitoxin [Mycolicibacterium psychrotolerans]|uniref:type IV toxin-antitoxin system AbiEi family antitoxin n=1 Tax=Mycolicibacterium psychrotolerans TaxID=216929 RepID=UPI003D678B7E